MNSNNKFMSGIRDVIYRLRYKTIADPINNGFKLLLATNYIKWYLSYKYFGKKYKITLQNGFKSLVYPYPDHDAGEANIFTRNVDYMDNEFIRKNISKGDFIVDAGSNVGNRTLVLCDIISGALLIDPNPIAIKRVKENLQLNNLNIENFHLVQKGVGEILEKKKFTNYGGASTQNTVIEEGTLVDDFIITEISTIDDELSVIGKIPSFIKIDVEGYDFKVIKGSINTLKSGKVKLLKFENNDKSIIEDIITFFTQINWEVFSLDDNGKLSTHKSVIISSDNLFASPIMNQLKY